LIVNDGLLLALNVLFGATAKPSNWYCGFISSTSFTAISASDTMASHSGWTEFTGYDESARPVVTFGAASDNAIGNPTVAEITPSAAADIVGFFLTTSSTKSGTSGYMFCAHPFDEGTRSVSAGVLQQFTIAIADSNINA
jgi:hypothetical protein